MGKDVNIKNMNSKAKLKEKLYVELMENDLRRLGNMVRFLDGDLEDSDDKVEMTKRSLENFISDRKSFIKEVKEKNLGLDNNG